MSEGVPLPQASPPATIPLKRAHEDEHAPSVSSPLNPNAGARGPQREQRTKKETLKKREATGGAPAGSKAAVVNAEDAFFMKHASVPHDGCD